MKTYIGIDPGKTGSVTVLNEDGIVLYKTPTILEEYDIVGMSNLLRPFHPSNSLVIIERAQAMPKQGVVSMFKFGKGYGIWLGILGCLGLSYMVVHSRTWTRVMLDGAPGEGKERAVHVARKLFPIWEPKLKKEYQYADSILLAEYGRRLDKGEKDE